MNEPFLRYDESIEVTQPNEDEIVGKIIASMARVNQRTFDQHRHGMRDAHAKSHGILRGMLTVYESLPEHLKQGLFREPRTYPIIARLSSAPGNMHSDSVPALFGMAIKLIGVAGKKVLAENEGDVTQDFLLVNRPILPMGDVAAYLKVQQLAEKRGNPPDIVLKATAKAADGLNAVLKLAGRGNAILDALGASRTHILGETFHSMAALRYGDYVGKISAAPLSPSVKQLTGKPLDPDGDDSMMRDLVVEFFRTQSAQYELRVQLCTDVAKMPVEDASVPWPEADSPHQPIARIEFPKQDAYSPARRIYGDDVLSFNPWHCISDHRPLGSIMRVRRKAYESSSKFRHEMNALPRVEPKNIDDLPE